MRETLEVIFFSFVFAGLVYMVFQAGRNETGLFVVLVFWAGLFEYLGKVVVGLWFYNAYKLGVVSFALYLAFSGIRGLKSSWEKQVACTFAAFSVFFWLSFWVNGGGLLVVAYRYVYVYAFPFLVFFILKTAVSSRSSLEYMKDLLLKILYVQVLLSLVKMLVFVLAQGKSPEAHVGSIAHGGASTAVFIPLLALVFFWLVRQGRFSRVDWLIACSFLFIGLASQKRAPIILFPLLLLLLYVFFKGKNPFIQLLKFLPLLLILFYLGVRMVPTLTPEKKIWGSFSLPFVVDYVMKYNFGTTKIREVFSSEIPSRGRGAGVLLLFQPSRLNLHGARDLVFGQGIYRVARATGRDRFTGRNAGFGIRHWGLLGEANAVLYALGYPGLVLMVLFAWSVLAGAKNRKLLILLFGLFLWEFLLYKNQLLFNGASALLVIFTCYYAGFVVFKKGSPGRSGEGEQNGNDSPGIECGLC